MKWDKYYILCISIIKSLKTFTVTNQVVIIMEENMTAIRYPKTFYFHFDWTKYIDEKLKHGIECIITSNESLANNKIKNEIKQLLLQ